MRCGVFCLFLISLVITAWAEPLPAQEWARRVPEYSASKKAILEALNRPVTVSEVKTPLGDIIKYLSEATDVPIRYDITSLEEAGLTTDTEVTIAADGVSLRSALNTLLNEHGLTWLIEYEAVLITTRERGDLMMVNYVYDVRELVAVGPYAESDFESLIEVITSTIAPQTWDEVGGPGSIEAYENDRLMGLVVAQTQPIHDQIIRLLDAMRRASDARGPAIKARLLEPRPFESMASRRREPRHLQRVYADSPRWIMPRVHH